MYATDLIKQMNRGPFQPLEIHLNDGSVERHNDHDSNRRRKMRRPAAGDPMHDPCGFRFYEMWADPGRGGRLTLALILAALSAALWVNGVESWWTLVVGAVGALLLLLAFLMD
jgi:hypothetical protein